MAIVIGLDAAVARSGLPRTSLRRLVTKGKLTASKDASGTWTFDGDELDKLRAVRAETASVGAVAEPGPASTVASASTAPVPTGTIAPWLTDAADARDRETAEVDDDELLPPYNGVPLGASRTAWPYNAVVNSTSPRLAELEQLLATVSAESDRWQSTYRAARIRSIADAIVHEAMDASRGDVQAAQAAGYAAARALDALSSEQLTVDAVAFEVARRVGHEVGASLARANRDANDIERARARRRSRSPRW